VFVGQNKFSVWERSGVIHAEMEDLQGINSAVMSWKPSGELLATCQTQPHQQLVAFFERNGLKHGDFKIPKEWIVTGMEWSPRADILALLLHPTKVTF
jgi:elongator complex protein 1